MAVLNFKGYIVEDSSYQRNNNYVPVAKPVNLTPDIETTNDVQGSNILVKLRVSVGSTSNKAMPFRASITINGTFEFNVSEDDSGVGVDMLIRNNAVAILYPYARALIANLTLSSNEYPAVTLPTINVAKVLANSERQIGVVTNSKNQLSVFCRVKGETYWADFLKPLI